MKAGYVSTVDSGNLAGALIAVSEGLRQLGRAPATHAGPEVGRGRLEALAQRAAAYADGRIDWLDGVTVQYDDWWFNVRPSNTEPLLRLVCEARTAAQLEARMAELIARIGHPVDH